MTSGGTIFLRINCYASVLCSAKTKYLIEGLTSLGLISNSNFMARLPDWMGAMTGLGEGHGQIAPWIRHCLYSRFMMR